MREILRYPALRAGLAAAVLFALFGCGSGSSGVPVEALENGSLDVVGKRLQVELNDGRSMRIDASRVEYPYIWGERFTGTRMPRREMRIDLRDVVKMRILESG